MKTLVLSLSGLATGYGHGDRAIYRLSNPVPLRSHIVGMLMAACGYDRGEWPNWVDTLYISVQPIHAPTAPYTDYQTVRGCITYDGSSGRDAISYRQYWTDSSCSVTVSGDDSIIDTIDHAVRHPRWQLYLGRRSCVPCVPVWTVFNP
jgi:CRISPR system Cascade subunit CasD